MAKPTLLQSLLNRPSQSYYFPPERDYHVVKRDILRTVAPTSGSQLGTRPIDSKSPTPQEKEGAAPASSAAISSRADVPITTTPVAAPISIQSTELNSEDNSSSDSSANSSDKESDSDQDCFYTPNASPRVSLANNTITISRPNSLRIPSDTNLKPDHSHSIPSSSASSLSSTTATGDDSSLFSEPLTESTLPTSAMTSDAGLDAPSKRARVNTAPAAAKPRPAKRRQSGSYTAEDWEQEAQTQARRPAPPAAVAAPLPRKPGQIAKTMSRANPSLMMNMAVLMEEDEETQAVMTPPLSRVLVTAAASRTRTASAPRSSSSSGGPRSSSTSAGSSSNGSSRSANVRRRRSRSLGYSDSRSPLARVVATESITTTHEPVDVHAEPYAPQLPSSGTPGYTSLTLPRAPMSAGMVLGSAHAKGKNRLSVFSAIDIISGADGHVDLTRSGTAQTTMATAEVVRGLGGAASRNPLKRMFSSRRREAREGRQTALGFTSHRPPPTYVPPNSVLVQVWAVGVDTLDGRLVGIDVDSRCRKSPGKERASTDRQADVGYIPGRSFVGRVLQCGWEVRDEQTRRGDWVVGLLDVRKAGALAEFVVVDRHRVRRVRQPRMQKHALDDSPEPAEQAYPTPPPSRPSTPSLSGAMPSIRPTPGSRRSSRPMHIPPQIPTLTLEELALLPLVGVPAFRAVRTLLFAFAGSPAKQREPHQRSASMDDINRHPADLKAFMAALSGTSNDAKRALVLMGHDGVGAFATQLLVRRGWRVSVHAPGPRRDEESNMAAIEARARRWGAEEVVFDDAGEGGEGGATGAVVRVLERLTDDGDTFDAVLDTIGGRAIWEASEKLLRGSSPVSPPATPSSLRRSLSVRKRRGPPRFAQFTTLVGDTPEKPVPTAGDHYRAGMRAMRGRESGDSGDRARVGYAWVDPVSDVDWASAGVGDAIEGALAAAVREGVRPWVAGNDEGERAARVVTFERAPDVFVDGNEVLEEGGTVVVKVVG